MAFPLKNDFVAGGPVNQFDADWHNTVSNILNYLSGVGVVIQKTPVPGQASPWKLVVDIASAFNGFLNANAATIQPPANTGSAGAALTSSAAKADHAHPAQPTGLGSQVHIDTSAGGGAVATTWLANNANKQPLKIWRHRCYYDGTTGSEKLVGVKHYEIYNPVTGGLIEVGGESTYTIHTPEAEL